MKLLSLSFAILLIASVSASSQVISFGLGANLTFPSAELKDNVATGYGGTALAKFGLLPLVDLTGGIEYVKFTDKDITVGTITESGTGSAFGILVGGRMSVLAVGYFGAETGTYSFTKKVAGTENSYTKGFFAPMVGVNFMMFDLAARYVSAGEDSFWGLRGLIWL
jgi:hypothetical protein